MSCSISRTTVYLLLTFVVLGNVAGVAQAQYPNRSGGSTYTPHSSPLPIYLDYFRRDVGVLDPYNNFVRPKRQLTQALQQQQQRIDYLQQQQIQGSMQGVAPTGTSARFFNYSHYYPGMRNR